jgi:hypothetical protein
LKIYSSDEFDNLKFISNSNESKPSVVTNWNQYNSLINDLQLYYISHELVEQGKESYHLEELSQDWEPFDSFSRKFEKENG